MAIVDFDTECWDDPWFQKLEPLQRYLFMYLWTNPHRNVAAFYIITMETIKNETRLSEKQIFDIIAKLVPKVKYDPARSVCWVVKHVRRQFLRSGIISEQTKKGVRRAALKLHYHQFFPEFIDQYPEVFSPEEKETLYRPPTDPLETPYREPIGGQGGGGEGERSSVVMVTPVVKEKNNSPNSDPEPNPNALRLSTLLFSLIKERDPKAKQPNLEKWAIHMDRLIRIDQRTPEEIETIIRWCQKDEFWQDNILSAEKLREQFLQLNLKMNKIEAHQPEDPFDKRLAQIKKIRETHHEHS